MREPFCVADEDASWPVASQRSSVPDLRKAHLRSYEHHASKLQSFDGMRTSRRVGEGTDE